LALDDGIDRKERETAPVDAGLGEQRHIGRRRAERPLALGSPEAACKPLANLNLVLVPGRRIRSRRVRLPNRRAAILPLVGVLSVANQAGPFPISPPARKTLSTSARFNGVDFARLSFAPLPRTAPWRSRNRPSH
jgi:hypothetical protein